MNVQSLWPAANYGTSGLAQWIQNNVVTVVILVLAVAVLWAARAGNIGKGITITAGALVGVSMLGLATGTSAADIGQFIVNLFRQGGAGMRLHDDDELYEVDQTYLGPPGRYIAPMRHKAIFAWLLLGPLTLVIVRRLGVPMTFLTVGLLLLGTVWAAMTIADHTSTERPVASVLITSWRDLGARRPARRGRRARAPGAGRGGRSRVGDVS